MAVCDIQWVFPTRHAYIDGYNGQKCASLQKFRCNKQDERTKLLQHKEYDAFKSINRSQACIQWAVHLHSIIRIWECLTSWRKTIGLGKFIIIIFTSNISLYSESFLKCWVITYGPERKQLCVSSICISVKLESTRRILSKSCQERRRFLADESLLKLLLPTAGGSGTQLVVNNAGAVLEMCWKMTA